MSGRFVNIALLVLSLAVAGSGILLFSTNLPIHAWLYDAHRVIGLMLLLLLIPKMRIIWRALARQLARHSFVSIHTLASILLAGFTILTFAFVFAWTLDLLPFYVQIFVWATPLAFHWYVALAFLGPLFVHTLRRFPRGATYKNAMTRREALYALGLSAVAVLGWSGLSALAGLTDFARRFTGSRLANSFSGNDFPITHSEAPRRIKPQEWRLRVRGEREIEMTYAEVLSQATDELVATVDCTLGWASTQKWRGLALVRLLDQAGTVSHARQITIRAANGYYATLSLEEARASLLATHVGDETLSHEHGFPARLVAPSRRGYHWIKWVNEVETVI